MNLTLPEHYKELLDSERKILQTLALIGTSTSLNTLVNCLTAADIRNTNNTPFTSAIIKPILFGLANKGWVDMMSNFTTIVCKDKYKSPLVFDMIDDEVYFSKTYASINRFYSAWSYYHNAEASFDGSSRNSRYTRIGGACIECIWSNLVDHVGGCVQRTNIFISQQTHAITDNACRAGTIFLPCAEGGELFAIN